MSNIGLPMPHIEDHFDCEGLCLCPCDECTTRTGKLCVCLECPCDMTDSEAPTHFAYQWLDS